MAARLFTRRPVWIGGIAVVLLLGCLSIPAVRDQVQKSLGSLRMQKVRAVNVDLSPFVDANANPTLHQMVVQMISDLVTGPFMNGMAQYGVRRGSVNPAIVIDVRPASLSPCGRRDGRVRGEARAQPDA